VERSLQAFIRVKKGGYETEQNGDVLDTVKSSEGSAMFLK